MKVIFFIVNCAWHWSVIMVCAMVFFPNLVSQIGHANFCNYLLFLVFSINILRTDIVKGQL